MGLPRARHRQPPARSTSHRRRGRSTKSSPPPDRFDRGAGQPRSAPLPSPSSAGRRLPRVRLHRRQSVRSMHQPAALRRAGRRAAHRVRARQRELDGHRGATWTVINRRRRWPRTEHHPVAQPGHGNHAQRRRRRAAAFLADADAAGARRATGLAPNLLPHADSDYRATASPSARRPVAQGYQRGGK